MSRARGFTLIEVLVALAIVAFGMAAVMGAINSSAKTISYLRDKTFANWVALNKIASVRISGQPPAKGNSNGDIDFGDRKWHWRMEVVATDVPGLLRMDVRTRPADVKADEDSGWFTTVSGIYGSAVAQTDGVTPNWGSQNPGLGGGTGAPQNGVQNPAQNPATPTTSPPTTGTGTGTQ
jgi:general secretion pathway protein I